MSRYKIFRCVVRWKKESVELSGGVTVSDGSILKIRGLRRTRVAGLWTWKVFPKAKGSGLSLDVEAATDAYLEFKTGAGEFKIPVARLLEEKQIDSLNGTVTTELLGPAEGAASISPSRVVAGSRATIALEYVVGESGMGAGGGIRVCFSLRSRWKSFGNPVAAYINRNVTKDELKDRPYTSRYASSGIILDVNGPEGICETSAHLPRLTGGSVTVRVIGNALLAGDIIRLEFRDAILPEDANRAFPMVVFVDAEGEGVFRELEESPRLDIAPARGRCLHIITPSAVGAEENFTARIQVMDSYMNPVDVFQGEVRLVGGGMKGLRERVAFPCDGEPRGSIEGLRLDQDKPGRIVAGGSVSGKGNYTFEVDNGLRLFWGELHEHSIVSDGYESPVFLYEYARDVACLDFCAACDHAHHTTHTGWEKSRQATGDFHEPGRFVTFFGYEWGNAHGGDFNIYAKEEIPCSHTGLGSGFPMPFIGEHSVERARENLPITALWKELEGLDVLAIPHHLYHVFTGESSAGLDVYGGEELEPVVEVFSNWGGSEYRGCSSYPEVGKIELQHFPHYIRAEKGRFLFQDMLARGYRVGVIGGSDAHISRPGHLNARWPHKPGLAAIYAPELGRDALFDAIRKRRCYATTGTRIFVDFRVNDAMMGEVVTLPPEEPPDISYRVGGTNRLLEVHVVKDGQVIHRQLCEEEVASGTIMDSGPDANESYYYLRAFQEDGEMAWSSPIWVVRNQK
jgi:hypothetical protein